MNQRPSDQSSPKVFVVTVVFNDVKNLERTILSVLNQTYKNIEYIIIDGGSTDGTVEVIKKYADRLQYWVSESDKGMFDAMNKGVARSTGGWVNILNSGDYFISDTIFQEIFSEAHPDSDILYGSFVGNFSDRPVVCKPLDDVTVEAYKGMQACHSTLFVKTKIARKIPYDLKYRHSADGEFELHCIAAGYRFKNLGKIIFQVGTLGNSFNNWLHCRLENWQICRHYFPGIKTDWFHFRKLARESTFRFFKAVTSIFGLYQLARYIYRKKLKKKFPLLPKGIERYNG